MADVKAKQQGMKVITGKVRFSYAHVFEPKAFDNQPEAKYQACILIDKEDKDTLKAIKAAMEEAKTEGIKSKWGGKLPTKKFFLALRDGDEEHPEDPSFEGKYYLNAKSNTKPGIIDKRKEKIEDPEEFYSGCYGRASVTFFPFASAGNNGVGVFLNNIQKLEDGERLSGRSDAASDFDDLEEDEDDDFLF